MCLIFIIFSLYIFHFSCISCIVLTFEFQKFFAPIKLRFAVYTRIQLKDSFIVGYFFYILDYLYCIRNIYFRGFFLPFKNRLEVYYIYIYTRIRLEKAEIYIDTKDIIFFYFLDYLFIYY